MLEKCDGDITYQKKRNVMESLTISCQEQMLPSYFVVIEYIKKP